MNGTECARTGQHEHSASGIGLERTPENRPTHANVRRSDDLAAVRGTKDPITRTVGETPTVTWGPTTERDRQRTVTPTTTVRVVLPSEVFGRINVTVRRRVRKHGTTRCRAMRRQYAVNGTHSPSHLVPTQTVLCHVQSPFPVRIMHTLSHQPRAYARGTTNLFLRRQVALAHRLARASRMYIYDSVFLRRA